MDICPAFEPLFFNNISDPRYYQVYGGRGSGKSFAVAIAAVKKTDSKFGHKILYLRQTMTSSDDSTMADVKLAIELLGMSDKFSYANNRYTNIYTGSTISFKGIESKGSHTAKLKSLSGITTLIIEEAEEIKSFDDFSKIDESIRVIGKPLKVILVYNPGSAIQSWIHSEWFINGVPNPERFHDTCFIHTTYLDNLDNLADSTVQRYKDLESKNPTYYIHTILAEWTIDVSNRIYEGWAEYPAFYDEGDKWYGLDFGYGGKDSTALVEINYFEDVYYIREIFCEAKMGISEMVHAMRVGGVKANDLVVADSAAPILITELRKAGFHKIRKAKKGPHSQEQGIKKVQDMDIVIVGECPHLYFGYVTFRRNDSGSLPHEPDALAALRYGLTYKQTKQGGKMIQGGSNIIKSNRY